jgi:hypothetical protein
MGCLENDLTRMLDYQIDRNQLHHGGAKFLIVFTPPTRLVLLAAIKGQNVARKTYLGLISSCDCNSA